jgi:hypothetical protein
MPEFNGNRPVGECVGGAREPVAIASVVAERPWELEQQSVESSRLAQRRQSAREKVVLSLRPWRRTFVGEPLPGFRQKAEIRLRSRRFHPIGRRLWRRRVIEGAVYLHAVQIPSYHAQAVDSFGRRINHILPIGITPPGCSN